MIRSLRVLPAVLAVLATMLVAPTPAQASTCAVTVGGYRGMRVCEYRVREVTWPDQHKQYFVIGTDYAVWTIHELAPYSNRYSGWYSLGGEARSGVIVPSMGWTYIHIEVRGTTGFWYCNLWYDPNVHGGSGWSGWFEC